MSHPSTSNPSTVPTAPVPTARRTSDRGTQTEHVPSLESKSNSEIHARLQEVEQQRDALLASVQGLRAQMAARADQATSMTLANQATVATLVHTNTTLAEVTEALASERDSHDRECAAREELVWSQELKDSEHERTVEELVNDLREEREYSEQLEARIIQMQKAQQYADGDEQVAYEGERAEDDENEEYFIAEGETNDVDLATRISVRTPEPGSRAQQAPRPVFLPNIHAELLPPKSELRKAAKQLQDL
ncbi:hypothetical protein RQP46_011369 [Phenoliferia psychrophenolica]